jgi:hypothetical protein
MSPPDFQPTLAPPMLHRQANMAQLLEGNHHAVGRWFGSSISRAGRRVEFIDENGGGPGVRLRKQKRDPSKK